MSTSDEATSSDGFQVVINAEDLLKKAESLKSSEAAPADLKRHLTSAIVPAGAFGRITGGREAAHRLLVAVQQHLDAIEPWASASPTSPHGYRPPPNSPIKPNPTPRKWRASPNPSKPRTRTERTDQPLSMNTGGTTTR